MSFAERVPDAEPRVFAVIVLGKHGSRELNYSSDIDPIFLFDPETLPRRPREDPIDAAQRIGRRVVALLSARDGDGYVFRADLPSRPSPAATPLALPDDAAISYFSPPPLRREQPAPLRTRLAPGAHGLGIDFL